MSQNEATERQYAGVSPSAPATSRSASGESQP